MILSTRKTDKKRQKSRSAWYEFSDTTSLLQTQKVCMGESWMPTAHAFPVLTSPIWPRFEERSWDTETNWFTLKCTSLVSLPGIEATPSALWPRGHRGSAVTTALSCWWWNGDPVISVDDLKSHEMDDDVDRGRILVQVTIYRRLPIGRDCHLDQSEAYDIS